MSDDATPRLGLPYLAAAQAQKHVTLNEALARLDALVQTAVESRTVSAQPTTPVDGGLYLLPAGATGSDWGGQAAGALMRFEAGAWQALVSPDGLVALVKDESSLIVRIGGAWVDLTSIIRILSNLTGLGVNASADAVNRLVVKSQAVLFDHAGAGVQVKIDKATADDTGSVLFQTAYTGRAEIGLCGDDDLHLRVSPDGSSFSDAITIDHLHARVGVGVSAPTSRLQVDGCVRVKSYAVAALPTASSEGAGAIAFATDESGGPTLVFSDGTAWRRVADRAVTS